MQRGSSTEPTTLPGSLRSVYRIPWYRTSPWLGRVRPTIIRIVVDLPAPFGPTNPVTRPVLTVKLVSGENEGAREQTLTLAGPVAGGQLAARSSDRQAVLMLPGSLLAELRGKVAAVRQAEPLQPAPGATPSPAG